MTISPNNERLLAAIQATLPNVPIVRVFLRNGRWWAASSRGSAHDVRFVWFVTVLQAKALYLRCGQSTVDSYLLDFRQADDLACLFMKLKPAHTELIIGYEGV